MPDLVLPGILTNDFTLLNLFCYILCLAKTLLLETIFSPRLTNITECLYNHTISLWTWWYPSPPPPCSIYADYIPSYMNIELNLLLDAFPGTAQLSWHFHSACPSSQPVSLCCGRAGRHQMETVGNAYTVCNITHVHVCTYWLRYSGTAICWLESLLAQKTTDWKPY